MNKFGRVKMFIGQLKMDHLPRQYRQRMPSFGSVKNQKVIPIWIIFTPSARTVVKRDTRFCKNPSFGGSKSKLNNKCVVDGFFKWFINHSFNFLLISILWLTSRLTFDSKGHNSSIKGIKNFKKNLVEERILMHLYIKFHTLK